mmetsp:Transcript_13243/g.48236  ORF Transcript_13243/g.48236 Transcript_13243/m.48236 type:complete len:164 (+) Transcript_13243:197-688(+)
MPNANSGAEPEEVAVEAITQLEEPKPEAVAKPPEAEEEKKEPECAFCAYMEAGPCGEVFRKWDECVQKAKQEGDFTELCLDPTKDLSECMQKHMEYYEPVLMMDRQSMEEDQVEDLPEKASEPEKPAEPDGAKPTETMDAEPVSAATGEQEDGSQPPAASDKD